MRSVVRCAVFLMATTAAAQTAEVGVSQLKVKAAAGDLSAQVALGRAYDNGNGVPQNDREAVRWYRTAAEQNDAEAQNALGVMYAIGHGVDKDFNEAANWYRKAARQGNATAMFNLATLYYNGNGVEVDDKAAYAWFVLAEKAGSKEAADGVRRLMTDTPAWKLREAKLVLADMLLKGKVVDANVRDAIALYEEVATQAPEVSVVLGKLYIFYPGLAHDYVKAQQYCTTAANAGFSSGMVCLAYLYEAGLLGPNRENEAFVLYEKAARLGNAVAWYALGVLYYQGWGTRQDLHEAYKWLYLAKEAHLGPAAKLLDSVAAQIGPKAAANLMKKALEERRKIYQKKAPRSEITVLSDNDLAFTTVIGPKNVDAFR